MSDSSALLGFQCAVLDLSDDRLDLRCKRWVQLRCTLQFCHSACLVARREVRRSEPEVQLRVLLVRLDTHLPDAYDAVILFCVYVYLEQPRIVYYHGAKAVLKKRVGSLTLSCVEKPCRVEYACVSVGRSRVKRLLE